MKTKHEFKVGQVYRTRDGRTAIISSILEEGAEPISAEYPMTATLNGAHEITLSSTGNYFCDEDFSEHATDLMELLLTAEGVPTKPASRDDEHLKRLWIETYLVILKNYVSSAGAAQIAGSKADKAVEEFKRAFHYEP